MRIVLGLGLCLAFVCSADAAQFQPNCQDPQSNLEMKMCASRELTAAEGELKIAFDNALKAAEEQYVSVRSEPGIERMPNMPEELRKAQRAWEAFREANCGYQNLVYYGGSMAPLAVTGCLRDMTKARTKELRDLVEP
jgi:uncharacterized protein YecT (DUF1311 family)